MVAYIVTTIAIVIAAVFAFLYFSKRPTLLTGKSEIPKHLQENEVMENWGEAEGEKDELNKKLKEVNKQKEVNVTADDEVRKREIKEREKILDNSIPLKLKQQDKDEPYSIIGYDKTDYGKLISLLIDGSGEKAWFYYRKGDDIQNIVGGKPLNEMIDKIDNENNRIFIRFNKEETHIKKEFEQF